MVTYVYTNVVDETLYEQNSELAWQVIMLADCYCVTTLVESMTDSILSKYLNVETVFDCLARIKVLLRYNRFVNLTVEYALNHLRDVVNHPLFTEFENKHSVLANRLLKSHFLPSAQVRDVIKYIREHGRDNNPEIDSFDVNHGLSSGSS